MVILSFVASMRIPLAIRLDLHSLPKDLLGPVCYMLCVVLYNDSIFIGNMHYSSA